MQAVASCSSKLGVGNKLKISILACELQDETAKKGMFGFPVDNTIGGTPQPNGWMDDWVQFYRERRLQHQLKLTKDPKLQQLGKKLCDNLEHFFQDVQVGDATLQQTSEMEFSSLPCKQAYCS